MYLCDAIILNFHSLIILEAQVIFSKKEADPRFFVRENENKSPVFSLKSPYSVRVQKNKDQRNSECGHFLRTKPFSETRKIPM